MPKCPFHCISRNDIKPVESQFSTSDRMSSSYIQYIIIRSMHCWPVATNYSSELASFHCDGIFISDCFVFFKFFVYTPNAIIVWKLLIVYIWFNLNRPKIQKDVNINYYYVYYFSIRISFNPFNLLSIISYSHEAILYETNHWHLSNWNER